MLETPTLAFEKFEIVNVLVIANRMVQTLVTSHIFTVSHDQDNSAKGMISSLDFMKIH